jgi:hypothetical protein
MKKNYLGFWIVALVLLVSSCATVNPYLAHYKSAQDAFNQASSTENMLKANPASAFSLAPETGYRTARSFIVKSMGEGQDDNKSALAADGLLLGAYSMKAMSEWKLGLYAEALNTSKNCQITFERDDAVKNQRDYIVMSIMEPRIYNDSIATYIGRQNNRQAIDAVSTLEAGYLNTLEKSYDIVEVRRKDLPADHALQAYLLIAQLSIAKNWKNLFDSQLQRLSVNGKSDIYHSWREAGERRMDALNNKLALSFEELAKILGDSKHPIYMQWKKAHSDVSGI